MYRGYISHLLGLSTDFLYILNNDIDRFMTRFKGNENMIYKAMVGLRSSKDQNTLLEALRDGRDFQKIYPTRRILIYCKHDEEIGWLPYSYRSVSEITCR